MKHIAAFLFCALAFFPGFLLKLNEALSLITNIL